MTLVDRAKNICLSPNTEWPVIAAEPATTGSLHDATPYRSRPSARSADSSAGRSLASPCRSAAPFALPSLAGSVAAVFAFCMAIVGVFILSAIINALAPTFGGQKNSTQALKVAVYCLHAGVDCRRAADCAAARHPGDLRRLVWLAISCISASRA